MPESASATDEQQSQNEAPAEGSSKVTAHAAEFPEANENQVSASSGQFDILLDMDLPITVVLGATQIPVRRLLQLGPGAVLKLDKPVGAPAELYLKESKFADADVVVVDDRFAVRIKKITGAGITESQTKA